MAWPNILRLDQNVLSGKNTGAHLTQKPRLSKIVKALRLTVLLACTWSLPAGAGTPDDIAVIIGNSNYGEDIPDIAYAGRDADAIKAWLIGVRGFKADNIIDIRDATKAQMEATFGSAGNPKGRLWRYADPADGAGVFVYYSGHGVPGLSDRKRYLLPVDTEPDFADVSGYPVSQLLQNLSSYRHATVIIDACFSGSSAGGTLFASSSGVQVSAKPEALSTTPSLTVLTAAGPGQLASWDHRSQHGLFTEYFLRGVYGEADLDLDGHIRVDEMKAFLDGDMSKIARRTYGREQDASLLGAADRVLATFNPWAKPSRPKIDTPPYRDSAVQVAKPAPAPAPQRPAPPPSWNPPAQPEPPQSEPAQSGPPESDSTTDLVLRTIIKGLDVYLAVEKLNRRTVSRKRTPVRLKPGSNAPEIGWIRKGQPVHVTGRVEGSNWLRVDLGGRSGYLKGNHLAQLRPGELERWNQAAASGRKNEYRKYLKNFPNGFFAPRARAELNSPPGQKKRK